MKKLFFTLSLALLAGIAIAQDLTYTVVNTVTGTNTGSIDLSVSGGVAPFTYSWTGPSGFVSATEDISGLEYGNYIVTVTDKYCGIAVITMFVDNDIASSVAENNTNPIAVFPNPASGQISVTSEKMLDGARFRLVNTAGQTIIEKNDISGNAFVVDLSGVSKGVYFIEINNSGTISRIRFVKN